MHNNVYNFDVTLGWEGSNLRVAESKSAALPLGDTPDTIYNITLSSLRDMLSRVDKF